MTLRSASYSLVIVALAFASMGGDCGLGVHLTMASQPCDVQPIPVTFQAEAGCGPGGPIVFHSSSQYPGFDISNAGALGLAPLSGNSSNCEWTSGSYQGGSANGDGGVCPIRYDDSTWEFTVQQEVGFDGKSLPNCDCSLGCGAVTLETCNAVLADGGGSLTCQPSDGGAPCTSRLTEVGDGGTE